MTAAGYVALASLGFTMLIAAFGIVWRLGKMSAKLGSAIEVLAEAIKELKSEQVVARQTATNVAVLIERVDNLEGDVDSLRMTRKH